MAKLKILFVTTEIAPFLKVSNAADIIRTLPQGLQERGHEIRILMPKFGVISERKNRLHEVVRLSGINIRVGNEEKPLTIKVATIPNARLQVYFLDNEDYFQRKSVLVDPTSNSFHRDNDERAIFFCKGVIETVKKLGWAPDIIHCHDWMTGLIPLYLKTHYKDDPMFKRTKVVYTVYNNEYDCPLPSNFADKARLEGVPADLLQCSPNSTYVGVSRGGIQLADAVTQGDDIRNRELKSLLEARGGSRAVDSCDSAVDYYNQLYRSILN